jgi:hypothetical protein
MREPSLEDEGSGNADHSWDQKYAEASFILFLLVNYYKDKLVKPLASSACGYVIVKF